MARGDRREPICGVGVLEDTSLASQQRVMAEANLELELSKTKDPGDLLNKRILAGFFHALQTSDPELRRLLILAIYSKLRSDFPEGEVAAESYREKLMEGMQMPSEGSIRRALEGLHMNRDIVEEVSLLEEYIFHL